MGEIGVVDEPYGVLFRGDYYLLLPFKFVETFCDGIQILPVEVVVIGEHLDLYRGLESFQIAHKGFGIGYSGKHQHSVVLSEPAHVGSVLADIRKQRAEGGVVETREEQFLIGEQFQIVLEYAVFNGFELWGAFGHHHHVGAVDGFGRFAQAPQREQLVEKHGIVELCEHNRHRRFHIAVLEGVVEHYEVDAGVEPQKLLDAGTAILAYGHGYVASVFLVNLVGLVTDVEGGGAGSGQHEALGLAFVSPREHADVVLVAQQVDDVFRVRGLAGAPCRDVAYNHNRHRKFPLFEYVPFEHKVAHSHCESVDFRQWEQQYG